MLQKAIFVLDASHRLRAEYETVEYQSSNQFFVQYTSMGQDVGHYDCLIPQRDIQTGEQQQNQSNITSSATPTVTDVIQFLSPPPKLSTSRPRKWKADLLL